MSEENVELARRGYEAFANADTDMETVLAGLDPAIEVGGPGEVMGEESYYGHAGFLRVRGTMAGGVGRVPSGQAFEGMWIEAEEFLDAGDRVVIPIRFGGRARHTGLDVEFQVTHLCTYRAGKLLRDEIYPTKAEALQAAGLSE